MSFSSDIKNELAEIVPNARHCRMAELAALVSMLGRFDGALLYVTAENGQSVKKTLDLIRKLGLTAGEHEIVTIKSNSRKNLYQLCLDKEDSEKVCLALKANGELEISAIVYQQSCCKRAFLRGAFMAAGSVTDPNKDYHFEIVCDTGGQAEAILKCMSAYGIEARVIRRKNRSVVYIKDAERIVDVLNIMEAHVSLMELENVRILKDMRNSVNRRVNCEAANIGKTIEAAGKQITDIMYIRDTVGFDRLSEELRATAVLRLEHPESSLSELGALHDRPIGRSGVNHRLSKLSEMAEDLRKGRPI